MKRYLIYVLGSCMVAAQVAIERSVFAQAEADEVIVVSGESASETKFEDPDAAGVIPSISHHGDILDLLKLLSAATHKNIIPSRQVRGTVTVNLYDVTYDEILDVVLTVNDFAYEEKDSFIYVYTKQEYEQLLAASRKMETRVFRLNYISASDMQGMINPLLSESAKVTTSPASGGATVRTGDQWASGNYIIILDYPEQLEQIATIIAELDQRPAQVLVEATILVASLDDENTLGVDFNILAGVDFSDIVVGGTTLTSPISGTVMDVESGTKGLKIGIFKNNMEILIEALETVTDVVTLGNPKILTLNRQEGKVMVGNRDGYITTEVSQTTTTQTVEFLETGTQLTFRPFVMDDGYIRMELDVKDSDGGVELKGEFTLPSETTANVTSNVLVKDGHTIVIGGLFREKVSMSHAQVPLLGNLPLVGPAFRKTTDTTTREEVIFLITPHIVKESVDYAAAEEVLANTNALLLGLREGVLGNGRDSLASAHYQFAKQHQAAGRLGFAIWHATVATQNSPGFLDAVKLREELLERQVYDEDYGSMQRFMRKLIADDMGVGLGSDQAIEEEAFSSDSWEAESWDEWSEFSLELAQDEFVLPEADSEVYEDSWSESSESDVEIDNTELESEWAPLADEDASEQDFSEFQTEDAWEYETEASEVEAEGAAAEDGEVSYVEEEDVEVEQSDVE